LVDGHAALHIIFSILIFLGLAILVIVKKNKSELKLFCIGFLWFFIFLIPIFFMPFGATIKLFEHRLYLPIIGILVAIIPLINYAIEKKIILVLIVGSAITIFYCFQIIGYLPSFSDSFEFNKNAALLSPNSARAQLNFGKAYAEKNDLEQAKKYIDLSLKLDSNVHYTRYYLALYKFIPEQKWDSALVLLNKELELTPNFPNNYLEISRCYLNKNNLLKAEEYLEIYCTKLPEDKRMGDFMLKLYLQNNHIEKAKKYSQYLIKNSTPIDSNLMKIVNQYK
jgi:tetratricopeptide (TPR) repeat protein